MWFKRKKTEKLLLEKADLFIQSSRKYRSRVRSGIIVLVTHDTVISDVLSDIADDCSQTIEIIRVTNSKKAREIIEKMDEKSIKAVVIEANMIDDNANGGSLPRWMSQNHSSVPVWVYNCNSRKKKVVRRCSVMAGVLGDGAALLDQIHQIGFPSDCKKESI